MRRDPPWRMARSDMPASPAGACRAAADAPRERTALQGLDHRAYCRLRAQARLLTRCKAEADDLVQETLLAVLRAGRVDPAWLAGVMRRQAAMAVRGEVRRRRRERHEGFLSATGDGDPAQPAGVDAGPLLQRLPPAARRVAVLALHGLSAEEIRWILRIPPTAFRQRLSTIRRTLAAMPPALRREIGELAGRRDPARCVELPFGRVRRALKATMAVVPALGAHDPDGHLLLVRGAAHTRAPDGNEVG